MINMNGNYVAWTHIGSEDAVWPFMPWRAIEGAHGTHTRDDPLWLQLAMRGDSGHQVMQWPGEVMAVAPIGRNAIVYGTGGVTAMYTVVDPLSTYGFVEILGRGVTDRGAVGVAPNRHVFIDSDGVLWQVTGDLELQRLGYQEFLAPLLQDQISIVYDSFEDDFYISSGSESFVLTPSGLSKSPWQYCSIVDADGRQLGVYKAVADQSFMLVTQAMDMGTTEIKTIRSVELHGDMVNNLRASISYRITEQAYTNSPWKLVDRGRFAHLNVPAKEFKVRLATASGTNLHDLALQSVSVHWSIGERYNSEVLS